MRIISFAWTTPALKALRKRCTRRSWDDAYALTWHAGDYGAAYDRLPRARGKQFGVVRLTQRPYKERTGAMPETDFDNEGLQWMDERHLLILGKTPRQFWDDWKAADEELWVIRFEIATVTSTTLNYSFWPELTINEQ